MRPVVEWDESDLLALIRVEEKESLTLDYKRSAALSKQDDEKNELSRDVSSFANSEGGLLIYGMIEDGHVPVAIDTGVDRNVLSKEWLESVVKSRIHPEVAGVVIKPIDLPSKGANMVAYVIEIPQATSRAPHQAFDHRYYGRSNFEAKPLEDYQVRDLMRRSLDYGRKYGAAWDLNVEVNRIIAAINERGQIDGSMHVPRDRLVISVSNALRSAGNAMVLLAKPIRNEVASLLKEVDEFNAVIETTDPGRHEKARLNEHRKNELANMLQIGLRISRALEAILDTEP